MSEKKLTPAEAFEHLKALFPWIKRIEKSSMYKDGLFFRNPQGNGLHFHEININWGDAFDYKPERWRPATIEDLAKAVMAATPCRVDDSKGAKLDGLLVGGRQNAFESPIAFVDHQKTVMGFEMSAVEVLDN